MDSASLTTPLEGELFNEGRILIKVAIANPPRPDHEIRDAGPAQVAGGILAIGRNILDLKTLAAASGDRKIHLVPVKDLPKLTGYIRRGVTALAAKKSYPVYADNSIERFEHISISAGIRGLQILLSPSDDLKITKATVAAIAQGKRRSGIADSTL